MHMDFRYVGVSGNAPRAGSVAGVASKVADLLSDGRMQAQVRKGAVPEAPWREALRSMCDEAHATGVPPEQLLREVKEAVAILCDTCAVPYGPARMEFTSRVVTLCIEEYYAFAGDISAGTYACSDSTRSSR
jgi:hypothetical protein